MAVPAAMMSITGGMFLRAFTITLVSSQSDRLSGVISPPAKACMINALLLMLFEAGNLMVVSRCLGA